MRIIGVTGAIASGKSTITRMLANLGARTFSADEDARAVLADPQVLNAVFDTFPEFRNPDNTLNRPALGSRIFANPEARKQLEQILHPPIRLRMRGTIAAARDSGESGVLVYEVPLLFEGNHQSLFDYIIVALANPKLQAERLQERERLAGRPPLRDEAVAARLSAQMSPEEKAGRADFVIKTDTSLAETERQVRQIWNEHFL